MNYNSKFYPFKRFNMIIIIIKILQEKINNFMKLSF